MPDLKIEGENEVKNIYKSKNNNNTMKLSILFLLNLLRISKIKDVKIEGSSYRSRLYYDKKTKKVKLRKK